MKSRKRAAAKRVVSILLALSMAASVFVSFAEEDASSAGDTSAQETAASTEGEGGTGVTLMSKVQDANTFSNYLDKNAEKPFTTGQFVLDAADAAISETGAERLGEYYGQENVVSLTEEGYLEWTFNAPETALYEFNIFYAAVKAKSREIEMNLKIDGSLPYEDAGKIGLSRVWKDEGPIMQDSKGNDRTPEQIEEIKWQDVPLKDFAGYTNRNFNVLLEQGSHTIRIEVRREAMAVKSLTLHGQKEVPSYNTVKAEYDSKGYKAAAEDGGKYQAEVTAYKSDSYLIPTYDRSSPATEPYHVSKIRRNTIGKNTWGMNGSSISYTIDVPQSGLYKMAIKFQQNEQIGMSTFRDIFIDGEIPYKEMQNVAFPYNANWQIKTIETEDGEPCYIYLEKGTHTVTFQSSLGLWGDVLRHIEVVNKQLSETYRRIIMLTGANPDPYRDYRLQESIPGLVQTLQYSADKLYEYANEFDALNKEKATQADILRRSADRIYAFLKKPDEIQLRLDDFRTSITGVSSWLLERTVQSLVLDYFCIQTPDAELPNPNASFWTKLKHGFGSFFASFFEDYDTISDAGEKKDAITVWIGDGRDQTQIVKDMIEDTFTPNTGIEVNLALTQGGLIESSLAGTGPDVAVNIARAQPVNFAARGMLVDLSQFDTFESVKSRFAEDALLPYEFSGGTYGIPSKQTFPMMFYRTDIFEELGIEPPDTWTEFNEIMPVLQRNNMEVKLPYSAITVAGVADGGIGTKDLFSTLFMQMGGSFYNKDQSASDLDSDAGLSAFKMWTDLYTKTKVPLTLDFGTRFRYGEVPLGIDSVETYNVLSATAPEIRGLWAMVPVPGMEKEDGTIDRSVGASGNASVILNKAKDKESCWKFIDWFSSAEAQQRFGTQVENLLGASARYMTANLEAFEQLPWNKEEQAVIAEQREHVVEIPEVPGSYFIPRCIDNAFRDVYYKDANPREVWEREVNTINKEIQRKREELHIGE